MNKKILSILILFICGIICGTVMAIRENHNVNFCMNGEKYPSVSVCNGTYDEIINPYFCPQDGILYYFLPAALCGNKIYNKQLIEGIYIDNQLIEQRTEFEWISGETHTILYQGNEINAKFCKSSDIPVIFISTDSDGIEQLSTDKSYVVNGKADFIEENGNLCYSSKLILKGRGNSTYRSFEKKPFNIKLAKAAEIFGMNINKDWCLLANSWDYSYMNNKLAFDMAKKAGFRYVPDTVYADVYLNGDYWGIYLVTEKIEVDEGRIDITDLKKKNKKANPDIDLTMTNTFDLGYERGVYLENSPTDITGGYLLECDYRLRADYVSRVFTTSYFETADFGTPINIKSPEYASKEEIEYIRALVNEMEQSIVSDDGFSEKGKFYLDYIDLDSWVKWYMIAEIAYDLDKKGTNIYFYKDTDNIDSKFYIGPVWDYDCRFGGTEKYSSPDVLTKLKFQGDGWCTHLYKKPEFFEKICDEWTSVYKDYLENEASHNIDNWSELIWKSVYMDNIRWHRGENYPVKWPYGNNEFRTDYVFDDETEYLKNWIKKRCIYLDKYWGNN